MVDQNTKKCSRDYTETIMYSTSENNIDLAVNNISTAVCKKIRANGSIIGHS